MKNKKLGKILLCTTLALATPFALAACGKKADDNNTPDTPQEQQQEVRANYVKEVTWPTTSSSVTKTTYQDDDSVRADLVKIMYDESLLRDPAHPEVEPSQQAIEYYTAALTAAINEHIKDTEEGRKVNSELSAKYVYTVTEDMIPNRDNNKTLAQYYDEYFDAYAEKYTADKDWKAVPDSEGIFYTSTATEYVLICFEIDKPTKKITIYELSFSKDGIETAYAEIQAQLQTGNN